MPRPRALLLAALPIALLILAPPTAGAGDDPLPLAPGAPTVDALPGGDLDRAVELFGRGELRAARYELEGLLARRRGVGASTRVRARFLLGWIHAQLGNHQLASASFYRVRKLDEHPLKEPAAFFEARADLNRGHPRTSIAECGTYRETWPEGSWFDECLLVEADSHVALGNHRTAIDMYEDFLESHPDDQRSETIQLRIAQALEGAGKHEAAARRYRALYISHRLPMTARLATEGLERVRAAGVEVADVSERQLYARACSLREAGQFDESWGLYCELLDRAEAAAEGAEADPDAADAGATTEPPVDPDAIEGDASLQGLLRAERHEFLWRNRRFSEVGDERAWAYQRAPDASGAAEHLYWAVQGYAKAGRWDDAVKWQEVGLERFPRSRRFARTWERSSKIYAAAGEFTKAREATLEWHRHSSRARRSSKGRFFAAYYAYRAKDYETAAEELSELASGRSRYRVGALYWRNRTYQRLKRWREARDDRRQVIEEAPDGWYATVIRSEQRRKESDPATMALARDGRWPGRSRREMELPAAPASTALADAVARAWAVPRAGTRAPDAALPVERDSDGRPVVRPPFDGWSRLESLLSEEEAAEAAVASGEAPGEAGPSAEDPVATRRSVELGALTVPPVWERGEHYDPERGRKLWADFSETNAEHWPQLPMAYELSRCGLGELAGPILARVYEEVRDVRRSSRRRSRVARWRSRGGEGDPQMARWAAILDMEFRAWEWREMFAAAGYPASVSAFSLDSVSLGRMDRSSDEGRAAWTLRFPAAYSPHVWQASWEHDVDPLLLLSLMRAESLYKHDAVSRAGALGLIQVMPTTGNKVAALMGDEDFRVDRLLEPAVNIRLGAFYLGRLMDRFEGQFPLAVGSYNGGPHNVGRWLRPKVGIPFPEMVEEIQFDETRNYIKRVVEYYTVYAELYGQGGWVLLPEETLQDDPSVINF